MRNILIALVIGAVGATGSAALANPTLDTSANPAWRNAPESTAVQAGSETPRLKSAYEQDQPFTFNP